MIRSLIIDDEQHCINRLSQLLEPMGNLLLAGTYKTVEEGIRAIKDHRPQLVFLDVQIGDQTGFDLLRKLGKIEFELIFTTAYDHYAVQAFKFSAMDYLLKPIDRDDLVQAVEKVNEKLDKKDLSKRVEVLLDNVHKMDRHKRISIPTSDGLLFVEVSDIIRCQSDVNYTHVFLKGNKKITVSKTLKTFEGLLSECNFFRIHNSHLINIECVIKYTKGKGGYVTMNDKSHIEVSSRRKEEFLKRL